MPGVYSWLLVTQGIFFSLVTNNSCLKFLQALISNLQEEAKDIVKAIAEIDNSTAALQSVREKVDVHQSQWKNCARVWILNHPNLNLWMSKALQQYQGFIQDFSTGGPASLASQILYLITKLGMSLTRPFPGLAIKQRVWSVRLGFSRSSMQRDLSIPQCIQLTLLERGGFGSLQGWADPENLEGWDLIEAKASILNKKLKFLHCAVRII